MNTPKLFLHELIRSAWYIEPVTAMGLVPLVTKFLSGEQPIEADYNGHQAPEIFNGFVTENGDRLSYNAYFAGMMDKSKPVVHVAPYMGVLSKWGSSVGMGNRQLANMMAMLDKEDFIVAHLKQLDTPGGSAAGLKVSNQMVKSMQKPVISYVDGLAASAGMWEASSGQEIYASDGQDIMGSIGTMMSWIDLKGYYEKEGAKVHELYATLSTRKNEASRLKDTEKMYEMLRKEVLDPHNEEFHNAIRENLPQVNELSESDQEMIFSGATFTAEKALSFGIINGISSFDAVIERAFALGAERSTRKMKVS